MNQTEEFEMNFISALVDSQIFDPLKASEREAPIFQALRASDFLLPRCGAAYDVIRTIPIDGRMIDSVAYTCHIEATSYADTFDGWYAWVNTMNGRLVQHYKLRKLAEGIMLASRTRQARVELKTVGDLIPDLNLALATELGSLESFHEVRDHAMRIVDSVGIPKRPPTMAEMAAEVADEAISGTCPQPILSGIHALDAIVSLQPGNYFCAGAMRSGGKSTFGAQLCLNMTQAGYPCLFISTEMTFKEITKRLLANVTGIEIKAQESGGKSDSMKTALAVGRETLAQRSLHCRVISDLDAIESEVVQHVKAHGVKVVVIDYIQNIKNTRRKFGSRNDEISDTSRTFKSLAMDHGLVFVVLSQFSREAAKDKPEMHHLRDSGSLEQDADQVILLARHDDYTDRLAFRVAKNRNGPIQPKWDGNFFAVDFPIFKILPGNYDGPVSEDIFT